MQSEPVGVPGTEEHIVCESYQNRVWYEVPDGVIRHAKGGARARSEDRAARAPPLHDSNSSVYDIKQG